MNKRYQNDLIRFLFIALAPYLLRLSKTLQSYLIWNLKVKLDLIQSSAANPNLISCQSNRHDCAEYAHVSALGWVALLGIRHGCAENAHSRALTGSGKTPLFNICHHPNLIFSRTNLSNFFQCILYWQIK